MSSVSFHAVRKTFDDVVALHGLDLSIAAGEFVALLGPSGSGKSTTLNLLAGLIDADDGEIRIGDRVVNDLPPNRRDIAMVFQNYALYPHLTVFENLAFPLQARNRRIAAAELDSRVGRVAATLGLAELLHRYPKELSGGQQQRVSLGRAMIRDPQVFLLDEPLSNLDARLRIRMRRDIKALHAQIGSTIVYVTHDQAEAMTLADRIAVFNEGRLQQFAAPEEIYNRPANQFVAGFVGEREPVFLRGSVLVEGGVWHFASAQARLSVPATEVPQLIGLHGREVVLCLRPEAVHAERTGEAGAPAIVQHVELSGPDAMIYAGLETGAELCCRADPSQRFAKGERVLLQLAGPLLTAFDPQGQQALAQWK